MSRAMRVVAPALGFALAAACASMRPSGFLGSSPSEAWPEVVANAQERAARGDFDKADSLLASFALRYPGSPEALETAYWRALFKLDPSNRSVSVPLALASLDGYLADRRPREHLVEAATLRRIAAQLDALNKLAANASSQARDATSAAASAKAVAADAKADAKATDANANAAVDAKDSEIKRLRDELAKANAELDRIRKRLSQPPTKP